MTSGSHYAIWRPLLLELVSARGHRLTLVTPLPDKELCNNEK